MKKMLSLAAMFAVLASASPAQAELKFGGDASVRLRDVSYFGDAADVANDDVVFQYRVRLKGAADLGNGYFFKTMITNETIAGGWMSLDNYEDSFNLEVSNFYFGRMLENCHYMVGRLPLGSFNNPIFDLTLAPNSPLGTPVFNLWMDRIFGLNYGTKLGNGMLNATLVVLDNASNDNTAAPGDGLFNDGYALHLDYKVNVGDVTFEPQFLTVLTNGNLMSQTISGSMTPGLGYGVTPYTFGALIGVPAGNDLKLTFGAFYTTCDDTTPNNFSKYGPYGGDDVNYDGYLLRVKAEVGNFMAWYDYNHTTDDVYDVKYTNHFVWAQYKIPVYSSAAGSFTIQPTFRYLASKVDNGMDWSGERLRSELWATVTF